MLTLWPSAVRTRVASSPAAENGTFTTTLSCSVRSARPSAIIDGASRETTSAETSPSMSSQMRTIASPGSPSSFASSEGFVVAPERTPHAAISSTSATDPVSINSLIAVLSSLAASVPTWADGSPSTGDVRLGRGLAAQLLRQKEVVGHVGLAAQRRSHGQEVDSGGDVVDSHDVGPGVSGVADRRERPGQAVAGGA